MAVIPQACKLSQDALSHWTACANRVSDRVRSTVAAAARAGTRG
eukprot:CAMPEP_0206328240 /NCGR_PEP_ID=MMETSP0106_2-20121207/22574_1 /ASSEMBLY_ACC=CAM_ASM_000206 /TAXON_ID=81532 /ORGANISM="Acanthoeca-like sp., Strain 10tr" /LENGTH=43 /DNA_ID= /DNA_START= /DNA_END= /DNA_ORIENTATION=